MKKGKVHNTKGRVNPKRGWGGRPERVQPKRRPLGGGDLTRVKRAGKTFLEREKQTKQMRREGGGENGGYIIEARAGRDLGSYREYEKVLLAAV